MILGMGIVFGFLAMLVFVLRFMSWMVGKFEDSGQTVTNDVRPTSNLQQSEQQLIAVISAAVTRYRMARLVR